jgi:hypothetical protein
MEDDSHGKDEDEDVENIDIDDNEENENEIVGDAGNVSVLAIDNNVEVSNFRRD